LLYQRKSSFNVTGFKGMCPEDAIKEEKGSGISLYETTIRAGPEKVWLWVAINSKIKSILAPGTSRKRNVFVGEAYRRFGQGSWKNRFLQMAVRYDILRFVDY
jgi:hypothetical protein